MAEEKTPEATESSGGGGSNKILMGLLGLNMVLVIAVGAILFVSQKKEDAAQSIQKIAEGANAEGGHGGGGGHGEPAAAGGHGGGGGGHGEPAAAGAPVVDIDARFYNVGEFTANLSGPGASHYVRLNVNLEMDKQVSEEEMKKRTPQIRDRIITLLNSKRPQDLQNADGRTFLKEEVKTSINAVLQTGKIAGVYFSTFVFE